MPAEEEEFVYFRMICIFCRVWIVCTRNLSL